MNKLPRNKLLLTGAAALLALSAGCSDFLAGVEATGDINGGGGTGQTWNYAVTFNPDKGAFVEDTPTDGVVVKRVRNPATKLTSFPRVSRPGYLFLGWRTAADHAFELTDTVTASMTLKAAWQWNVRSVSIDKAGVHIALAAMGESVTHGGYLYTSDDGGDTWYERRDAGARQWQSVSVSPDGLWIAASDQGGRVWVAAFPVGSTSASAARPWTWVALTNPLDSGDTSAPEGREWGAVALSNAGTHLIAADRGGGALFYTDDLDPVAGTATWARVSTPPVNGHDGTEDWSTVAISDDGAHMMGAEVGGYLTHRETVGGSWTGFDYKASGYSWNAVAYSADGATSVAASYKRGEASNANYSYILKSLDAGGVWDKAPASGWWKFIDLTADGTVAWAVAHNGGVYTYNLVTSTLEASAGGPTSGNWDALAADGDGSVVLAIDHSGYLWMRRPDGTGTSTWSWSTDVSVANPTETTP